MRLTPLMISNQRAAASEDRANAVPDESLE